MAQAKKQSHKEEQVVHAVTIPHTFGRLKVAAVVVLLALVALCSYGIYMLNREGVNEPVDGVYTLPDGSTSVFDEEQTQQNNEKFLEDNPDFINGDGTHLGDDDGNVQ